MYSLNSSLYGSVFVVPSVIVEKYIKMASFCAMKSLLWILKNQSGNFSISEIAKAIGSSECDTKEALDYWVNEGVLKSSDSSAEASPLKSDTFLAEKKSEKPVVEVPAKAPVPEIKIYRPTMEQIVARMDEDKKIKGLFNQAQIMLGRTIGFDVQSLLLMMHDTYGFGFEVILTLLQFCISTNHSSTAYIASTAKLWFEKEITDISLAQSFVDDYNKSEKTYEEFKQFTGMSAPKATPKQNEYFTRWRNMGFSTEMMVNAYNETVERTGKISFAYTDKILRNWHDNGTTTMEDVKKATEEYKNKKTADSSSGRSYDINKAIEKASGDDLIYKKKEKRRSE